MRWFAIPKMAISLPLAVLAAVVLISINEAGFRLSTQAVTRIEQSQATRGAVHLLLQQMLDAETGQRGYLLTGDPKYLEPYDAATAALNHTLDTLRGHYTAYPAELAEFGLLSRSVSRKLAEMDLSVRMRKQGNEEAWKFVLTTDVGMDQMNAIRSQIVKLIQASNSKMGTAQAQITRSLQLSRIGIALIALAGLLAFYMYLRQTGALLDAGRREQEALQRERDQLDKEVRDRTATLAELATHLQQVREDERGHLARELHDELGALLTAAKLDVARIKSRLGVMSPEAAERMQHLIETLNSGIALKRRIVEDLRPSSLSHLGLVASLEILAREFEDRSGLSIITDLETVELGGSAQLTIYRLVQESLTNMGKYADAKQAEISLHDFDGYIMVEVRDDGNGFDTTQIKGSSHGLAGMQHRVEAAGGRLTVASSPGQGTRISAVLPKSL
ncbi:MULTISPECIES: CHASE3 domain-containing protein [unclassified Polaromonas]|uniref:sensor histidine kinase n=2 Tax=unclassified Polaromonas TaxID=2638319 RepID=UPI000BD21446|nr:MULTISPECIES: CHASE3 domain-containing protein [unclassified Polaromonas]OYZ80015.1 MAG: histidine kinase [Polaromonas sp. 24-63-21]OZA52132.1 MAG: histidine kinase [Polaromonas sp. 17-63-33]OZA87836.1 MAG: histidine kinase [Polaromonas sp. 39-63-25]OYY35977.1 MAG: histidine kinase [Polaromonas sp. 35-63-35]OYZ19719.1 MAG: histidine kinase [Polaromonas sp. 16-63-31]